MCGFTGFITFNHQFTEQDLHSMTDCIAHRGPDSDGFFFNHICGLGHRRLSILDLSEAANQPFYSANGRYVMVYNGEVYNFQEIAQKLNVPLKTTSDTEVIIEAFVKWGPDFVQELNGMFAIAIYDLQENELHLYRDRIGIKPIYFYRNDTSFAFASELKALTKMQYLQGKLSLNKEAISQFFYVGYIPRPNSIYNEIHKMDSGSYTVVGQNKFETKAYWKLEDKVKPEMISDFNTAKQQLKDLVLSSVKYRMISDVPFGTFLSGGIDSSLVTAAAQENSSKPVKTFSIGFEEEQFNEAGFARNVSDHLKTDHHELIVTYKQAMDQVQNLMEIYDEPFGDPSSIPTLLVSELARKHVTMTLSGDGGDELFFGYGMYNWAERLDNPLVSTFRHPISWTLNQFGNRYQRAAKVFKFPSENTKKSHLFSQEQYFFAEEEINQLITPHFRQKPNLTESWEGIPRKLTPKENQAFFDMKYYLQDDLLVKVDRASMKHSLETRVPLLDYRIIEFALNLSPELKVKDGERKYLLKSVLYDFVPEKLFDRPKRGFAIPVARWLKGELNYLIKDFLNEQIINKYGIVDFNYVNKLILSFLNGKDYYYNRIWLLIILHKWLVDHEEIGRAHV